MAKLVLRFDRAATLGGSIAQRIAAADQVDHAVRGNGAADTPAYVMFEVGKERAMANVVMVEIPVWPEAATALSDERRRARIGKLVSEILRPSSSRKDPLAAVIAEIKSEARADNLSDEEIDAELAAYNAERRL